MFDIALIKHVKLGLQGHNDHVHRDLELDMRLGLQHGRLHQDPSLSRRGFPRPRRKVQWGEAILSVKGREES